MLYLTSTSFITVKLKFDVHVVRELILVRVRINKKMSLKSPSDIHNYFFPIAGEE